MHYTCIVLYLVAYSHIANIKLTLHCFVFFIATSALDARSEFHINQALRTMTQGRTVISIAHRLSTIKEADRIAVLKGGEIAEVGTYDELIRSKDSFHNLVAQQLMD